MKNSILLFIESSLSDDDLTFNNTYLPEVLAGMLGQSPNIGGCYFSVPDDYSGALNKNHSCFVRSGADDAAFWKELFAKTGAANIIKILCDSPFLDAALIADMLKTHTEYFAEFTYSENLPAGLTCEIIKKELADSLPETGPALPLTQIVRSNINRFDVELFYREPDIRDKRLSFRNSAPRDKKVMENLAALFGGIPPYSALAPLIKEHPEALYAGPSYLEIELTDGCELACIFCCRNELENAQPRSMERALFEKIMEDMKAFALPYTICMGGFGEPLMHKEAGAFIAAALDNPQVERLIVETNGLYIDEAYCAAARGKNGEKLITVVNINGHDRESYAAVHGADKFNAAAENISALYSSINGDTSRLFVQVMKINETEPFLDRCYDFWEEKKIPIILQKQNTYLGRVKDRRYSDLTPLERTPCWHLQRDMFILADGTVSFCKQDADGARSPGNAAEGISKIYTDRIKDYIDNWNGRYPASPDCASCDEWYTFNF
ncbi:MAG: spiro-SPASM protein [Spirochaetia bacterium]|jgi:spiro-SPASM protein|nr:spiro-SPASM protein [Spirochaetia bacterium]